MEIREETILLSSDNEVTVARDKGDTIITANGDPFSNIQVSSINRHGSEVQAHSQQIECACRQALQGLGSTAHGMISGAQESPGFVVMLGEAPCGPLHYEVESPASHLHFPSSQQAGLGVSWEGTCMLAYAFPLTILAKVLT